MYWRYRRMEKNELGLINMVYWPEGDWPKLCLSVCINFWDQPGLLILVTKKDTVESHWAPCNLPLELIPEFNAFLVSFLQEAPVEVSSG